MKTNEALIQEIDQTHVENKMAAVWWIGQMGFIVKIADQIFYFDPYLAPRKTRLVPPLLKPEQIVHANWVFGSHAHSDHIDRYALPGIAQASRQARFVCSNPAKSSVTGLGIDPCRIISLDEGSGYEEMGVKISAIAAQHETFDRQPGDGYPYLCFIIEYNGITILHMGDTLKYDGIISKLLKWKFDLVFVPINGRDAERLARRCYGNMTYQEAVDLAGDLQPQLTIPGHYDMFADNSEDPVKFTRYMDVKFPTLKYWAGSHGETVIIDFEQDTLPIGSQSTKTQEKI